MKRSTVKRQRRILRGWVKWTPVVAIPFAVLFFHTWLNIQILRADYTLRELDREARDWADRLNHTGVAETYHEDPAMLAEQAAQLAFVQPSPGQREIIYYDPAALVEQEEENFAVAQREGGNQTDSAAVEAPTEHVTQAPAPVMDGAVTEEVAPAAVESEAIPVPVPLAVPVPEPVQLAPEPALVDPDTTVNHPTPETPSAEAVVDLESAMESLESL